VGSLVYDGIQDEETIGKSSFRTVYVSSVKSDHIFCLSKLKN